MLFHTQLYQCMSMNRLSHWLVQYVYYTNVYNNNIYSYNIRTLANNNNNNEAIGILEATVCVHQVHYLQLIVISTSLFTGTVLCITCIHVHVHVYNTFEYGIYPDH